MIRRKLLALLGLTTTATVVGLPKCAEARVETPTPEPEALIVPVGTILGWVMERGEQIMPHWVVCDGRRLLVADYPDLFKAIGTFFGGDGIWFAIPDMRPAIMGGTHPCTIIGDDVPSHSHAIGACGTMADGWVSEPVHHHNNVPPMQPTLRVVQVIKVLP